jgi:LacI family transcriptional regulator
MRMTTRPDTRRATVSRSGLRPWESTAAGGARVTQRAVAEAVGVNQATVSYVLSGRRSGGRISEAVIRRIRATAERLGYVANQPAQALASGRTQTVGVLIEGWTRNRYAIVWNMLAEGLETRLLSAGYEVRLRRVEGRPFHNASLMLRQRLADAVVYIGQRAEAADAVPTPGRPPLVFIDWGAGMPRPRVTQDPVPGMRAAAAHLLGLGHRRVLWVAPASAARSPSRNRLESLRTALAEGGGGIDVLPLALGDAWHHGAADGAIARAREALAGRLPARPAFTAIACWNDLLAFAAAGVLEERGLCVPRDISLVGFDDIGAAWGRPPLTTVSGAFHGMGEAAAGIVLDMLRGKLSAADALKTARDVPTGLVVRRSTGPARDLKKRRLAP